MVDRLMDWKSESACNPCLATTFGGEGGIRTRLTAGDLPDLREDYGR